MKTNINNYCAPLLEFIDIEAGSCFVTSMHSSSHAGFSSNDGYDDDYWFESETEL